MTESQRLTAVLVPSYKRSDRMARFAGHVRRTAHHPHKLYFVLEERDEPSIWMARELMRLGAIDFYFVSDGRGVPAALNMAIGATREPWIAHVGDDVRLRDGWLAIAHLMMADKQVVVLGNAAHPLASGHFLFSRSYLDGQPAFHEYEHEYADAEFAMVAHKRGALHGQRPMVLEHARSHGDQEAMERDRLTFLRRCREQGLSTLGAENYSHITDTIEYA